MYGLPSFALVRLAEDVDLVEGAVLVEGHGAVEQEVGVTHEIERAFGVEAADMPVEQGVVGEAAHKLADHPFLLGRQLVGMGRIHGREVHVLHRIVLVPYPHRSGGKIYLV